MEKLWYHALVIYAKAPIQTYQQENIKQINNPYTKECKVLRWFIQPCISLQMRNILLFGKKKILQRIEKLFLELNYNFVMCLSNLKSLITTKDENIGFTNILLVEF